MDTLSKLEMLTGQASLDLENEKDAPSPSQARLNGETPPCGIPEIFRAKRSGGGETRLLKTMLTSACEKNCNYCAFRAGRNFRRATLKPEEMAKMFIQLQAGGIADGIFLSSGIIGGGIRTQDKIIDTAEILRKKYGFRGYIHLKLMPGSETAQVERTMQLANRISINLEAPNPVRLASLAPKKEFIHELLTPLQISEKVQRQMATRFYQPGLLPSLATQLVVGGAGENDVEILTTSAYLFQQLNLTRIYYSPFNPVPDTPLDGLPAENPIRKVRLYQASFLLRDYGYSMEDLPYNTDGNLPLDVDPKLIWARDNLSHHPVEINQADRVQLLRVPGIGLKGVQAILDYRSSQRVHELGELRNFGINPNKVAPFILINGKKPTQQLSLW